MFPSFIKNQRHDVYPAIDTQGALKDSLKGKKVVISGASQGIGRALSIAFAQAGAAKLALGARSQESLKETARLVKEAAPAVDVYTYYLDVTKPEKVETFWQSLNKDLGEADVLVNNSGYAPSVSLLGDSDVTDFWGSFEVNVLGVYLLTRQFVKHGRKDGTIINISSAVSRIPVIPGMTAYYTTKTAVNKLGEGTQAEYPDLRIFNIHPCTSPTEMNQKVFTTAELKVHNTDTVELAGGFAVWLSTATADALKGGYLSATWDVDELLAAQANGALNGPIRTVPDWEAL